MQDQVTGIEVTSSRAQFAKETLEKLRMKPAVQGAREKYVFRVQRRIPYRLS